MGFKPALYDGGSNADEYSGACDDGIAGAGGGDGEEAAKVVFSCGVSMPPAARALWGWGMF